MLRVSQDSFVFELPRFTFELPIFSCREGWRAAAERASSPIFRPQFRREARDSLVKKANFIRKLIRAWR